MEITFEKVSKQYKSKYALKNFTAALSEGVYGLLGENGAGKTTLINTFVGILCGDSGTIRVDGQDVRTLGKAFLSQIGYMPQYPIFYRDFTVKDFLLYMCALKDIPTHDAQDRVSELLATVNLTDAQDKKIGALSGGMRQRVGIVQAMLSDPKILILDEPTAGLDPSERIRFRNLISRFAQGRTILLATHIVSDVECIAREILLLKQGTLLMQGTPAALERNIEGKVWNVTVGAEDAVLLTDMYCVSNMKQEGEHFTLRIVEDGCPIKNAQSVQPNLEDVFLYYCRGNAMIRLIRYEFIKQFCKRSILALFVAFSLANLFKIYGEYTSYSYLADGSGARSWHTVYWQLYKEYRGEITPEKIEQLLAVYQPLAQATSDMTASTATDDPNTMTGNLYSDRNLLDKYYVTPMQYFYEYSSQAEQVANRARQNAALYEEQGAVYQQRESGAVYHLYAGRSIPAFAYQEMCNYYLNYDFSIVLTLMLCLYGIIGTFVSERETQMDMLLMVSPNGGRKTTLAKILAATLFLFLTSLWFSLLDLIGFVASFQTFEGLTLPVFAIPNFAEASVNLSIFQYVLLSAALKCAGTWVIGMLWLLVSMFWKNALLPFVVNFALCMVLVVSGAACAYSNFYWTKVLNPYSLLTTRVLLGKTEFVNLGGFPVLTWQAAVWISLTAGFVLVTAIYFLSAENCHRCVGRAK